MAEAEREIPQIDKDAELKHKMDGISLSHGSPEEGDDKEVAETNSGSLPPPDKTPIDPGGHGNQKTNPQTGIQKSKTKKSISDEDMKAPILEEGAPGSTTANNVMKIPTEDDDQQPKVEEKRKTFNQEAIEYLDKKYKNWKSPDTTVIVGEFPADKTSNPGATAEGRILHVLEEFGRQNREPMFVVHSSKFSELKMAFKDGGHVKKWVNGEHDFMIIHYKYGVIFIQAKAKVTCGKEYTKACKQLEKDKESLKIFLEENLGGQEGVRTRKTAAEMVYVCDFVAMPNCSKKDALSRKGLFKEDCEDTAAFRTWWDKNVANMTVQDFNQDVYEYLIIRFVGLLKISPSLQYRIDNTNKKIDNLTKQRLEALLEFGGAIQWITGPAGSGKTWLLENKVLQLAPKVDPKSGGILVLCKQEPFCQDLRRKFKNYDDKVHVLTYPDFILLSRAKQTKGEEKASYQHIFVDEAQDCVDTRPDWFGFIREFIVSDTAGRHYIWVMYDPNKCLVNSVRPEVQEEVTNASQLTKVVRNTEKIFNVFVKYYDADDGKEVTQCGSVGLDIVWDSSLSAKSGFPEKGKLVAKHVDRLCRENVKKSDICVLVEDIANKLQLVEQLQEKLPCQSAVESVVQEHNNEMEEKKEAIIVDTIENVGSLEIKVVILLDPPYMPTEKRSIEEVRRLLYIGLSRCSCYQIIISTDEGCKAVKSNLEEYVVYVPRGV